MARSEGPSAARLVVVPVGDVDDDHVGIVAEAVEDRLAVSTSIGSRMEPPPTVADDPADDGYALSALVDSVSGESARLGVTDAPLYDESGAPVYAGSTLGGRTAVVSTDLLVDDGTASTGRLRKAALKQVGHLFGVGACERETCLFAPVGLPWEYDDRNETPCEACLGIALDDGGDLHLGDVWNARDGDPTGNEPADDWSVVPSEADIEAARADASHDAAGLVDQLLDAVAGMRVWVALGAFFVGFLAYAAIIDAVLAATGGPAFGVGGFGLLDYGVLLLAAVLSATTLYEVGTVTLGTFFAVGLAVALAALWLVESLFGVTDTGGTLSLALYAVGALVAVAAIWATRTARARWRSE